MLGDFFEGRVELGQRDGDRATLQSSERLALAGDLGGKVRPS
jgi:hypothetical protein